jgi:glycosyltransferase involved in cell wall biosynthesis
MSEIIFWGSVGFIVYAYFGYPAALMALSLVRRRPVRKGSATPPVSFIITAHNEEGRIREKIQNTLNQDYPARRLEIIVASDCSTDGTDRIVRFFADRIPRIRLIRASQRRGKEAAQQLAVQAASGEVLVFSDVATSLSPDGISSIVRNFSDPTVGCVSSIDRFVDPDGRISGEGAYVRYEMFLRLLETRVNSLVGLSGSFFAARRQVCRNWAADRQSDFNTVMNAVELGLRAVLDPDSAGYYKNIVDETRERQRKIRTVVRGMSVLSKSLHMLNPLRYGLFSWQLMSHKLCRWLVPVAMTLAFVSNAVLITRSGFYAVMFILQLGFYAAAWGGARTRVRVLKLPSFLVVANIAILTAWFQYARGERFTTWLPSERATALPHSGSR